MKSLLRILAVTVLAMSANAQAETKSWNIEAKDIYGKSITKDFFKNKVTVVSFSSKDSQKLAESFGQQMGKTFGHRQGYHTLILPNTSELSFLLKPFAAGAIKDAEQDAVELAVQNQVDRGLKTAEAEAIRARITFVHDEDGKYWKSLGAKIEDSKFYFGILNAKGEFIYMNAIPDFKDTSRIVEKELRALKKAREQTTN